MSKPTGEWSKLDWLQSNEPGGQPAVPRSAAEAPLVFDPVAGLRLTYRPNSMFMTFCVIVCAVIGLVLWHMAASNDRGMLIEGVIHLSQSQATVALQVLSILVLAGAVLGLVVGLPRSFLKPEVVLDADAITLPVYRLRLRYQRIAFSDIREIKLSTVHRQKFMRFNYAGGSRTLNVNWLPDPAADQEAILTWIAERLEPKRH